jgi:heterodisulfide reductase subunit A
MSDSVLVLGGGIAGIQASLDLAHAGAQVVLVEKQPTIGGIMAVLDKNFPTLDCSICIEAPKMSEVDLHPNIEVISLAELDKLEGDVGDFTATIRQRGRYVTDACTRCGDCTSVCSIVVPNEFDSGMAARKAIYTPIPQSVPGEYLIDIEQCLNQPPNYIPCNRCVDVCPPGAIDFMQPEEQILARRVGAVIVAVGYDSFDPRHLTTWGYGQHPDILTALEFERLVNSAGPTGGEILRPSDGEHPHKLLFVLCVGSRDRRYARYCSRFCCMYSLKHAYQALDHGVEDVHIMYMDLRAYGKGFDGFKERTQAEGATYIRGRPARITPNGNGSLAVSYEDTKVGIRRTDAYDMVVLANAVLPQEGLQTLAEKLGIALDQDGFLLAHEEISGLISTTRPGIFAAGCASGPKDIPDSVAEGSGAAALAMAFVDERQWQAPPEVEPMEDIDTARVGVFVCHCGSNIAGVIDIQELVTHARTLPDVMYVSDQMFSCAGNTQKEIEDSIREHRINRVVIAACSPKTHESIFRGVMQRAGLNPFLLEMANIRNMDSWVHKHEKEEATAKAKDMVAMAVEKARRLEPLEIRELPLNQSVLVIGGGVAGMNAAVALSRQGFKTDLVERDSELGGMLRQLDVLSPSGIKAKDLLRAKKRELKQAKVKLHLGTEVETIGGIVGSFKARLSDGADIEAGALVVATGSKTYQPVEFGYGDDPTVITNLELETLLTSRKLDADHITFISCVGSRAGTMGCSRYCCTSMIDQALRLSVPIAGRLKNCLKKRRGPGCNSSATTLNKRPNPCSSIRMGVLRYWTNSREQEFRSRQIFSSSLWV